MSKRKAFRYPAASSGSIVLREPAALESSELTVNVRTAKNQLSSLLEQAAHGNEVIITSNGQPKAKLVAVRPGRRTFRTNWKLLHSMPKRRSGLSAEELVRADRDARG